MKKVLLFCAFVIFSTLLFAQTVEEEITNRMNYVFEKVNRGNVVTGILGNYGVQPIPLEYYDGIPADSNFVDLRIFTMLYAGVYSAKFNNNISLITPDELSQRIEGYSSGGAIPVGIMHYRYNRFKEDAVELGLVNVINEQIVEITGKNPYETLDLFAAGPKEVIIEGGDISFIFPSTLRMSNVNKSVQNLEIRFDDNLSFVNAGWNTVISHTYTSEGVKKVRFRINYTDGTSFTSQTNIFVHNIPPPTSGGLRAAGPGDAAGIGGARYDIVVAANSLHSGGKVQVKLASNNITGKIKKALIVAEGFEVPPRKRLLNFGLAPRERHPNIELDSTFLNPKIWLGSINRYSPNIYNAIADDYDIVYVDNNNGIDDIRRNAALFMQVLDLVNSPTYKEGNYPNVVMGISMGGLVARYALRKMEIQGRDHHTWKYISVDSPHKGANIPLGIQAMADHIASQELRVFFVTALKSTWLSGDLEDAVKMLNSPAAKQMMVYRLNSQNTDHQNFMQEYEQMGLPVKCQNIAISNGRLDGHKLFNEGDTLIQHQKTHSLEWWQEVLNNLIGSRLSLLTGFTNHSELLLNIFPGKSQLRITLEMNAISNIPNATIYHGKVQFKKKILWLINSSTTVMESTVKNPQVLFPLDGAPGGLYNISNIINMLDSADIKQPNFCFVPTVSALALNNWQSLLTTNLQGHDLFAQGKTDFEYISYPLNKSERHTLFDSSNGFLINQLKDKPISPDSFQPSFCGTQTVTVKNPLNRPLSWSVSDNTFTITSSSNTSANIASAPDIRNAVLTVSSSNLYPLKRRLMSTCNFYIFGPDKICSQGDYSVPLLPPGTTVTWSGGDKLNLTSGQGTGSAKFTKNGNGKSTIRAVVTIGSINSSLYKSVNVGVPSRPWVHKGSTIYKGSSATFEMCLGQGTTSVHLMMMNPDNSSDYSSWEVTKTVSPENFQIVQSENYLQINPLKIGGGAFKIRSRND